MAEDSDRDAAEDRSDYSRDADTWLKWADATYCGASKLFRSGDAILWFPAAILGAQALEMYLKAAVIRKGHRIVQNDVWGHDLKTLGTRLASEGATLPAGCLNGLETFGDFFDELRYPTRLRAVQGLGDEEGDLLDQLVAVLRPLASDPEAP